MFHLFNSFLLFIYLYTCRGVYNAYVDQKHVHTYENSGSFGELALLYNMPRAATIKVASDVGQLWALDRQTFRRILLKSAFRKRKMYENLINSVPMLKTLQNYERLNLADALIPKSYAPGELIIKQGEFFVWFLSVWISARNILDYLFRFFRVQIKFQILFALEKWLGSGSEAIFGYIIKFKIL